MRKLSSISRIAIHVNVWLLLILINYTFIKNRINEFDATFLLSAIALNASVFYVSYYVIMPFLFRKKYGLFILFSLAAITSGFALKSSLRNVYFTFPGNSDREMIPDFERGTGPGSRKMFFDENFPAAPDDTSSLYRNGTRKNRIQGIYSRGPQFDKPRSKFFNPHFREELLNILIFYIVAFALRLVQRWQDDEIHKQNMEKDKIQTELSFLKQQINPHFLFNSLNSIYSLSITKSDTASDSILKLSSILRYMLYESEKVSLNDELKIIKDYIDLQKMRLTDKVNLSYEVNGKPNSLQIEPFIIITLIENAFKYGADSLKESFIKIVLNIHGKGLALEVSNTIVQREKEKHDSGIGLKNLKRRLELIYPDLHQLVISNNNEVFSVMLTLTLKA